jgi:nitrate reductase gamma subunit
LPKIRHIHAARSADMVQLRMNRNGNPEVCDKLDWRLLQWYAFRGHISAIKALLHHYGQVYPLSSFETAGIEEAHHIVDALASGVANAMVLQARDQHGNTPLLLRRSRR